MAADWIKTSNATPTHGRAVAIFPPHNGVEFGCWNDYDKCWDTPDADDYMCNMEDVFCWCEISEVPSELKKEYYESKKG